MSFFQNTCKPSGLGGRLMVKMMNSGHAKLADWGFSQIQAKADARVLDAGCGGGANVAVWLKQCPKGRVTGMDYSEISVAETRKINDAAIKVVGATWCRATRRPCRFRLKRLTSYPRLKRFIFGRDWKRALRR